MRCISLIFNDDIFLNGICLTHGMKMYYNFCYICTNLKKSINYILACLKEISHLACLATGLP